MIDSSLIIFQEERLKETSVAFHRYMFDRINWNASMVGITGPRGVGKSTMVLQYMLAQADRKDMLYVSADHLYFSTHTLLELAETFVREGGKWLAIDEVHKYQGWSRELKNIYDGFPRLKVVFTGSSVLDINRGTTDLSRRALMYHMQGLSFREYLQLFHGIKSPVYSLEEILEGKVKIDGLEHPLPMFRRYLSGGYYPFALEGDFEQRMNQVVGLTVEGDIPQFADMKAATARKIKQLLAIIAESAPFKPNYENLASEIKVSKNNVPDYLAWLEKAGMISQLMDDTSGLRGLGKVEKVYIDNATLMSVLGGERTNTGNLRETFFYNQMRVNQTVVASKKADFRIADMVFEVGGKGKGQRQIADVAEGYVVKDDIEYAHGNVIPLYFFGFNY